MSLSIFKMLRSRSSSCCCAKFFFFSTIFFLKREDWKNTVDVTFELSHWPRSGGRPAVLLWSGRSAPGLWGVFLHQQQVSYREHVRVTLCTPHDDHPLFYFFFLNLLCIFDENEKNIQNSKSPFFFFHRSRYTRNPFFCAYLCDGFPEWNVCCMCATMATVFMHPPLVFFFCCLMVMRCERIW